MSNDCRGDRRLCTPEDEPWTRTFDRLTSIPTNWTRSGAAAYLGTLITQIYRWQDAGAFGRWTDTPTGRPWRVSRADLDAWLAHQQAARRRQPRDPDAPTT